jgi:hypothetical protein
MEDLMSHDRIIDISAVTLLLAAALVGCRNECPQSAPTAAATAPVPAASEVTVDAVKESPTRFYGKQVRVTGEVARVYSDRAFELDGAGWAFDDNIRVLTKTPVQVSGGPLVRDDELIVTGTVHPVVTADLERRLGWDLTPELEIELKERPVLIADVIRKVGEHGRWNADPAAAVVAPIAQVVTIVTTFDLDALVGQKVDLERERVLAVMGKGLWIGPGYMSQMFVLPTQAPTDIKAGDVVRVSGTLRKVPTNAVDSWGLPSMMAGVVRHETLFVDEAAVTRVDTQTGGPAT